MNDSHDFEKTLKQYRHVPDPDTKETVMETFRAAFADEHVEGRASVRGLRSATGMSRTPVRFWRRPVPLYVAAVAVILAMGLSFLAGLRSSPPTRPPVSRPSSVTEATPPGDIRWSIAETDAL